MKYILHLKGVFWEEPIVFELSEQEGEKSVAFWLKTIFEATNLDLSREYKIKIKNLIDSFLSEGDGIIASIGENTINVNLYEPIKSYVNNNLEIDSKQTKYIELIFSFSLGRKNYSRGSISLFDSLDLKKPIIRSEFPPNFEDRFAVVLGGGGAKGAAQAGALKALFETFGNINNSINVGAQVHYVVGSSIGAFNSMFVSSGKIEELEDFWLNVSPITGLKLIKELRKQISVEDLISKVEVTKVNLQSGTVEYAGQESLDIFDEVRKSMRIPPIFPAIKTEGQQFVDGGLLANLPISRCLENECRWILVLGLEKTYETNKKFSWPFSQAFRAIQLQGRELQRIQRVNLLTSDYLTRLLKIAQPKTFEDMLLVKNIQENIFVSNIIILPLEEHITTSTIWFSKKKCQQDFFSAYEDTLLKLDEIFSPLVLKFEQQYQSEK